MARVSAVLGLMCLMWASAAHAGAGKPVDLTMSWSVALDASGAITSLTPTQTTNPGLYQRLEPAIRKWHFTTGKVKGVPVASETTLTLHVTLEPVDGFYRVRLRDAGTGARYATMTPPKYPDDAVTSKRGGAVMLEVRYDASGKVTNAVVVEGGLPKPGNDIERAAVAAVKHWTFTPESIGGHGVAGIARVPMCFSAREGTDNACRWRVGESEVSLDTNTPLVMNSVVHLETEVAGRAL
jgi:TonB family protein